MRKPWRETTVRGDNDPIDVEPVIGLDVRFAAFCCDRTLIRRDKCSNTSFSRTFSEHDVRAISTAHHSERLKQDND